MRQIHGSRVSTRGFGVRMLCICVMAFLVYGILGVSAPDLEASAAAKKYTVTVTIKMGNSGSSCPELRFVKNGKTYIAQAVSKWYIDGKYTKDPWSRFYSKGWKFKKHKITVVMKKKLPKGSYKVSMDNGSKVKSLGKVKVKSKAVKKTFKFA